MHTCPDEGLSQRRVFTVGAFVMQCNGMGFKIREHYLQLTCERGMWDRVVGNIMNLHNIRVALQILNLLSINLLSFRLNRCGFFVFMSLILRERSSEKQCIRISYIIVVDISIFYIYMTSELQKVPKKFCFLVRFFFLTIYVISWYVILYVIHFYYPERLLQNNLQNRILNFP